MDGALEGLLGRWGQTLPALALVAAHVSVSARAAAQSYAATDTGVGEEFGGR